MNQSQTTPLPPAAIATAMDLAVKAARSFEGATAPNPPVGCVLLDSCGNVLATAAHQRAGTAHAEAAAIVTAQAAGVADRIDTLVVTLEPCNHQGRTPPCTNTILATPVLRVVVGVADPNRKVAGGGMARLREAGLAVELFTGDRQQLERLIAPFAKHASQGLPFLTVKQALNGEGSMIPPAGRKTFTSQGSLLAAHALRRRADAIISGSGTILADDPLFTVRLLPDHAGKRRPLVIFDRRRRVPQSYANGAAARGLDVQYADDLETALRALAAAGALEVLLEAGPMLTAHVLASPFWDEHVRISRNNDGDRIDIVARGGTDVLRHH